MNDQGRKHVLLVEDMDLMREDYAEIIRGLGYEVRAVGSAVEALSEVLDSSATFDFILSNFMLPDMRGDILIRELAFGGYAIRTLVLFTALSSDDPIVDALRSDIGEAASFRFVNKHPGCLIRFFKTPHLDHPYPLVETRGSDRVVTFHRTSGFPHAPIERMAR